MQLRNVVIVDGVRSPFARGGRGKLVATRLDDVGATVIRTLMERNPKSVWATWPRAASSSALAW
jgi:acetyl-CoA acetyltransferase